MTEAMNPVAIDEKALEAAESAGLNAFRKSGTQRDALRAAITAYLAVAPLSEREARMREASIQLCAAVDNLWNHPDLLRVRTEIPESIKINMSKGQLMVRAALTDNEGAKS